jgi:hypothetical protein
MDPLIFDCRVCKKRTQGKVLIEFTELLPPGLKCVECLSCGILGVELVPDAEV